MIECYYPVVFCLVPACLLQNYHSSLEVFVSILDRCHIIVRNLSLSHSTTSFSPKSVTRYLKFVGDILFSLLEVFLSQTHGKGLKWCLCVRAHACVSLLWVYVFWKCTWVCSEAHLLLYQVSNSGWIKMAMFCHRPAFVLMTAQKVPTKNLLYYLTACRGFFSVNY